LNYLILGIEVVTLEDIENIEVFFGVYDRTALVATEMVNALPITEWLGPVAV
jgi:hypothetical protein